MTDKLTDLIAELRGLTEPQDGTDGRDGRDGKDADHDVVAAMVAKALADMRKPRDGRDADPALVRQEAERAAALAAKDAERGPRGPRGLVGPMPRHEWDGTKLRFEQPEGWGAWVDVRGERGLPGEGGGGGGRLPTVDLNKLPAANPLVMPEQMIVRQNGVWLRMPWGVFLDMVGSTGPSGESYASGYADNYTGDGT
ncbi:MAG: hypothetical protein Q8R33_15525 [Burkholderiales bacterium]|nr:hypothetical protein [Burkholderiales bacterium]